jgi:hypothetical protein
MNFQPVEDRQTQLRARFLFAKYEGSNASTENVLEWWRQNYEIEHYAIFSDSTTHHLFLQFRKLIRPSNVCRQWQVPNF